jgi:hypothetical protein
MRVYEEAETIKHRAAVHEDDGGGESARPAISVFLPVLNEEPNLRPLAAEVI